MVTVYTGRLVERKSIMFTSLGAYLGCAIKRSACTGRRLCVHVSAARAGTGIRDDFQDLS